MKDEKKQQPIVIERTGQSSLAVDGEVIASAETSGPDVIRWHEIQVIRSRGGRYVVAIRYEARWKNEPSHATAEICNDLAGVEKVLTTYDPLEWYIGYPPGVQFESKQKAAMRELSMRFNVAVGKVLQSAGVKEVVE